jgi:hypothetical protein
MDRRGVKWMVGTWNGWWGRGTDGGGVERIVGAWNGS